MTGDIIFLTQRIFGMWLVIRIEFHLTTLAIKSKVAEKLAFYYNGIKGY